MAINGIHGIGLMLQQGERLNIQGKSYQKFFSFFSLIILGMNYCFPKLQEMYISYNT